MSAETAFREINRKDRAHQIPIKYNKRAAGERIFDFDEVILGFDGDTAIVEAARCIQCPEPQACTMNCPAGNDIPEALWLISQGSFVGAARIFSQTSPLPEVCGRVCPNLCQQGCVLGKFNGSISIGKLEAFVADIARKEGALRVQPSLEKTEKKVAVVGSGPAGITVAEDLVKKGHQVKVFEAWPVPGGVLVYGIPNFKLNKQVIQAKIKDLENAGVEFITNTRIGEKIGINDLLTEYDAVFIGTGAGTEGSMDIPGEDLNGVYKSTNYLIRCNVSQEMLPPQLRTKPIIGKKVAIIGGGDTAVDCARTSIRLGAEEVTIVYRRTEAEMPGNKVERAICLEEGVKIDYLQAPVEYIGDADGWVKEMKVIKMELGEPDASGRRRPNPIEGSEFIKEIDSVVLAVGYWPDPAIGKSTESLATHKWGLIVTDPSTGATTLEGVFAAGDNVHGPDLVITAVAEAHKAADGIHTFLLGNQVKLAEPPPKREKR